MPGKIRIKINTTAYMKILVINSGSSSLKFQLFQMPSQEPVHIGLIERIGLAGSAISNHADALREVISSLSKGGFVRDLEEIIAVGHRVVHGGEHFSGPTIITKEVKTKIKTLFSLAPLHNQISYTCIEVAEEAFPNAKQIAVFDTAFHHTLPEYAYRFAIPKKYYAEHRIRVYGFHGTSHKYVSSQAMKYLNNAEAKVISIHLGNGCSMAAVKSGKSVDTSMGFSPLSGLMMGTRSGDIDPSVIFHLLDQEGNSPEQINNLLNKGSGLFGVAGFNDMRDVHKAAVSGSEEAKLALELYAYRIKKYIGAYAAVLNGIDAVLFTGGVGENDKLMRAAVCTEMDYLGLIIDEGRNNSSKGKVFEINTEASPVKILVVQTNEECEIANQCFALLNEAGVENS
jgi:acetate kinase